MSRASRNTRTVVFPGRRAAILFGLMLCLSFTQHAWAKVGASDVEAPDDGVAGNGAAVSYALPADGALPRTYLVTLAIVDRRNPEWIVSTFVAGAPRTVTNENQGRFTETWNGLDDNFMPMPPGEYGVKGIYMPATRWGIDEEWHAVTPKYAGGLSAWHPRRDQADPKETLWRRPDHPAAARCRRRPEWCRGLLLPIHGERHAVPFGRPEQAGWL